MALRPQRLSRQSLPPTMSAQSMSNQRCPWQAPISRWMRWVANQAIRSAVGLFFEIVKVLQQSHSCWGSIIEPGEVIVFAQLSSRRLNTASSRASTRSSIDWQTPQQSRRPPPPSKKPCAMGANGARMHCGGLGPQGEGGNVNLKFYS